MIEDKHRDHFTIPDLLTRLEEFDSALPVRYDFGGFFPGFVGRSGLTFDESRATVGSLTSELRFCWTPRVPTDRLWVANPGQVSNTAIVGVRQHGSVVVL